MNTAKRVGTDGENWVLSRVRWFFPEADRAKAGSVGNDLWGLPIPVEVKRRQRWEPQLWGRLLTARHGDRWGLVMVPRDRRRSDSVPMIAYPLDFGLWLLSEAARNQEDNP